MMSRLVSLESVIPETIKAPTTQTEPDQSLQSFDSPRDFIESLLPHARKAAEQLGVEPRVLVAQAALETGWGQHMITDDNGGPSFNFFGIKATTDWQGGTAETTTHEYIEGRRLTMTDRFRAYSDPESAFQDYVDFLKANPRYQSALANADDPAAYTRGLQDAGYATDPHYADKILRIAGSDVMRWAGDAPTSGTAV